MKSEKNKENISLKQQLLFELESHRESAVSGQMIAEKFGVSRSAVWKAVNALKEEGYNILSSTNRGYRLSDDSDLISAEGIKSCLKKEYRELPIFCFNSLDSTNEEAKRRLASGVKSDFLVAAKEQTAGKGRNGRSFYSPKTGAYLTLVVHPKADLADTVCITSAAAVAVVKAIEELTDLKPQIKWVNDILINKRKAAGILTEAVTGFEEGIVTSVLVGIGLNVHKGDFPDDIKNKVSFIDEKNISKNQLTAKICENLLTLSKNLNDKSFFDVYREHSAVLNKNITYVKNGKKIFATAVDIDNTGALKVIKKDGTEETLKNGEISVKLA